jgi:hypothetical protein
LTVDVRIPFEEEILENPKRAKFLGGAWVDSSNPEVINVYWHKRQNRFTIYSLLQVLEHETLHVVLACFLSLYTSQKLDRVHRSKCVWLDKDRMIFVNEIKTKKWIFPPYHEEPAEDLLE